MQKILVVEDDIDILFIYVRVLTNAGYHVDEAKDGQEALDKFNANAYDLVLLDIMLPKVTGVDVLRKMKAPDSKDRDTPVYLLTNLAQDAIIKECFEIGAVGYIIKSQIEPRDIVKEVASFFDKQAK